LTSVRFYTNLICDRRDAPKGWEVPDLTVLLNRMRQGDREAGDKALAEVYSELHRIASREMRREGPGHTLQTTALISEAYLRFVNAGSLKIENRGHFYAVASQQMRRILVDHARARRTRKRDGGAKVELDNIQLAQQAPHVDVLLLEDALTELEKIQPRAAQVVELRFFGGYTDKEVVEALGVSMATVRRDWEYARSWLFQWMRGRPETES
jgi:RNA polymerase sigma-70 factor, ECF subfamily